jgi:hypothetical protein
MSESYWKVLRPKNKTKDLNRHKYFKYVLRQSTADRNLKVAF